MPRSRAVLPSLLIVLATVPCEAAQFVLSDGLQQEARTCVGEAAQICPDVWTAPDHCLACMTGKRQSFSPRCRVIYDRVAHALKVQ
ncbi:hypothetical protein D3273_24535 [Lichenibacterium minor]|uniref:Uncharacterized protein n=1 Tax=Lichenibacterium minor TaxID=2316528 RepID=A0A4Q2U0Z1_9HYPH|nr:hypothetical protein [Lichenibacterium minor]RYC29328.1 hypothetical protein D3273_24535 [Lichenibacterium minor]